MYLVLEKNFENLKGEIEMENQEVIEKINKAIGERGIAKKENGDLIFLGNFKGAEEIGEGITSGIAFSFSGENDVRFIGILGDFALSPKLTKEGYHSITLYIGEKEVSQLI